MYKKLKSLTKLEEMGLNTFPIWIPRTSQELLRIVKMAGKVTIRFDSVDENANDLPFYILQENWESLDFSCDQIFKEAYKSGCILLVSNGIHFDSAQKYNLVAKINKNKDFVVEACAEKVPLRKMYSYPLLSLAGNLNDKIHDWNVISGIYGIDRRQIKELLLELYDLGLTEHWIECTVYRHPVGKKNQPIVFWQIN